jgi:hypothetical protein
LGGGDDFASIINKIYTPENVVVLGKMIDLVRVQLKAKGSIKKNEYTDGVSRTPRLTIVRSTSS